MFQVDTNHYKRYMIDIRTVLEKNSGEPISITTIVDIMNLIGKCVVAGNVRRTAEIVFGDPDNRRILRFKKL